MSWVCGELQQIAATCGLTALWSNHPSEYCRFPARFYFSAGISLRCDWFSVILSCIPKSPMISHDFSECSAKYNRSSYTLPGFANIWGKKPPENKTMESSRFGKVGGLPPSKLCHAADSTASATQPAPPAVPDLVLPSLCHALAFPLPQWLLYPPTAPTPSDSAA